ncbi:unnamed protein product, partial [Porites lobata]
NIITKKTDNPCGQFLWTKKAAKPEALIMVETDSLSFILSCCSIPFYIIGLIGNVLVIRIVPKTREMHTPTNYPLARMAVSDVFTIMMFAAHSQHVLDENFGHLVCKASAVITTFAIVSSTTLTVLAVERYNALPKPFRTGLRLSEDSIKKAIALIWVTSVFLKSRCEVEEKLRSENFAATKTIGFDNAE